jgi:Aminoglycoside adenylyltransferase, C-terminal domain
VLDGNARSYLDALAETLAAALGPDLVGVYLHGSAALDDYDPARSDIDVLAVCRAPLADSARAAVADGLARDALPCPAAGGLELSLLTAAQARDPSPAPGYELHGWTAEGRLHPDDGRGDPDLPLHLAVARAHGTALRGPPPAEVFRAVARAEMLDRIAAELAWAGEHASQSYRVLGACRAWRYLEEGEIGSKRAAARWALDRRDAGPLVATVLRHHLAATPPDALDPAAVAAFCDAIAGRLGAELHRARCRE